MAALEEETYIRDLWLAGRIEEVKGGKSIFYKGDRAENAYRIIQGQVRLFTPVDDGGMFNPEELRPPSLFGVTSTILRGYYRLSAETVTDCRLVVINACSLQQLITTDPDFRVEILERMAPKVRSSYDRTIEAYDRAIAHQEENIKLPMYLIP